MILFHHQGGVDVGDVDEKALRVTVEVDSQPTKEQLSNALLINVKDPSKKECVILVYGFFSASIVSPLITFLIVGESHSLLLHSMMSTSICILRTWRLIH